MAKKPRVLIFIVAYHAETTIEKVLKRIPASLKDDYDVEILIIDDASTDATFQRARESRISGELPFPLTVLKNPVNQMYGGNQKIGFHYAIEKQFDYVALVHGDGQYAPEALPDLLKPLATNEADAVFGSRMATLTGALKGGMPLYKYVGNRILTFYQNTMLRSRLTEFHSGYRLYSTAALRKVPFHLNTDKFHFDTEIIIQLLFAGLRIREIPIPTHYGDEICRVNGLQYAWDVAKATAVARLQSFCLMYRRNFDVQPDSNSWAYRPKLDILSPQSLAIKSVNENSRVVYIGPNTGELSQPLREKGCVVIESNSTTEFPPEVADCDHIVMLDAIEQISQPEEFAAALRDSCAANRKVNLVVSAANIGFFIPRLMHLFGQLNYSRKGILDLTHTRLFTFESFRRLLEESGFEIIEERGVPAPFTLAIPHRSTAEFLMSINEKLIGMWRNMFSYQIYLVAKPKPTLKVLLQAAYHHSTALEQQASTPDAVEGFVTGQPANYIGVK